LIFSIVCEPDLAWGYRCDDLYLVGLLMSKVGSGKTKKPLLCSFCGKSQHEVRKLIAGPTVFICDECIELCMDIIGEENKSSLVKLGDGTPTCVYRKPHSF
jgi:hypothetical protein